MMTIFHYLKFGLTIIIGIVLLPIWVLYFITKYMIFRYTFTKNLQKYGIDKATAKSLSKELNIFLPHNYINWRSSPAK